MKLLCHLLNPLKYQAIDPRHPFPTDPFTSQFSHLGLRIDKEWYSSLSFTVGKLIQRHEKLHGQMILLRNGPLFQTMPESHKDGDVMSIFGKLVSQDLETLKEWIEEVSQEIDSRRELKRELVSKLSDGAEKVHSLINEIEHWAPGYKPSVNGRRTNLEKECLSLKKEERVQELNAWRDISILKRQLRELVKEYREALRRRDMVDYEV